MFSLLISVVLAEANPKISNETLIISGDGEITSDINYAYANEMITEVFINDSITSIGNNCFQDMSYLTTLTLPDTLLSIGDNCFKNCWKLSSLELPESLQKIGAGSFAGLGIESLSIPSTLESFGIGCFNELYQLKSLVIDNENSKYKSIDNIIFSYDSKKILVYPNGLDATSYNIPEGTEEVGEYCFYKNQVLTTIKLPESLKKICNYSFSNAEKLTEINVNVEEISEYAFFNCRSVTNLTIGPKVQVIKHNAFQQLYIIKEIVIPGTVKEIHDYAFSDCTDAVSIVIEEGVQSLGYGCFHFCKSITTITIPTSVVNYSTAIFGDCQGLKSITLQWQAVPEYTFYGCSALEEVQIPNAKTIGSDSFLLCTSLKTVNFGENLTRIGREAFSCCESLESINIPSECNISELAFYGCKSLKSISVSENNTKYAVVDGVLYTKDLKELILFPAALEIADYVIKASVEKICVGAFAYAKKLINVTIPVTIKEIGNSAFSWSESIIKVVYCGNMSVEGYLFANANASLKVQVSDEYPFETFGGVEVEKNTSVCKSSDSGEKNDEKSDSKKAITIISCVCAAVVVIAAAIICLICYIRKRKSELSNNDYRPMV